MIDESDPHWKTPGGVHYYRWLASHVSLIVAVCWTALFIGASAVVIIRFGVPSFSWAVVFLFGIWLGLVALAFWGQRNSNRRLKPVSVNEEGLWFGFANEAKSDFLPWDAIDKIESFSYPHYDAVYMHQKSGLRFHAGKQKFFIYEHIRGYAHLLEQIKSKAVVQ